MYTKDHLFGSKQAIDLLGIKKEQLRHWVHNKRMIDPAVEGKGRGKRNKLSFTNLLDLALIKKLSDVGIELNHIEEILIEVKKRCLGYLKAEGKPGKKAPMWTWIRDYRDFYEKQGCFLYISRDKKERTAFIGTEDDILEHAEEEIKDTEEEIQNVVAVKRLRNNESQLIIDVIKIARSLEKATGAKL